MFGFLHRLFQGFWPETKVYDIVPIDEDWVSVSSESEEKLSEKHKELLSSELIFLRQKNTSSTRMAIFNKVTQGLKDVVIPEIELTSDLRTRIFKDLLTKLSTDWLIELQAIAPGIQEQWFPSKYEKNVLGQLIDFTDHTAPNRLTPSGLAQTLRGIHMNIVQTLSLHRETQLNQDESDRVLELIATTLIHPLITRWISTTEQSSTSIIKQGKLPIKWNYEQEILDEKIKKIKSEGVSAKYAEGDLDPIRQAYLRKSKSTLLTKDDFKKRQASIVNDMQHRVIKKTEIKTEIGTAEFSRAKTSLGLFFRNEVRNSRR